MCQGHKVKIKVLKGIIIMMSVFPDHKGMKSSISTDRSWYLFPRPISNFSNPLWFWGRYFCALLGLSLSSCFETASPCLPSSLPLPRGASSISSLWGWVVRPVLQLSTEQVPSANDSLEIWCEDLMFPVPRLSPGCRHSPHSSLQAGLRRATKSLSLLSPAESCSLNMKISKQSSGVAWQTEASQDRPAGLVTSSLLFSFFFVSFHGCGFIYLSQRTGNFSWSNCWVFEPTSMGSNR